MRAKILLVVSTVFLLAVGLVSLSIYAHQDSCSSSDKKVYDGRIEQVKGKVTILNHPDLGKTPATGMYLVFQREGCEECLVATHADIDGNYKIFVGVGRYKLIVHENRCEVSGEGCSCFNLLAPDQPRYVDVQRSRPHNAEFNINIVLPTK